MQRKENTMDLSFRQEMQSIFKQLKKYEVLSHEEQRKLLVDYHTNNNRESFDKLVLHNWRMVMLYALRYSGFKKIRGSDLFQEGVFGLMEAIQKFNLENQNSLYVYAKSWIWVYMQRFIQKNLSAVRTPFRLKPTHDLNIEYGASAESVDWRKESCDINEIATPEDIVHEKLINEKINKILNSKALSDKQKFILKGIVFDDKVSMDMSKELGVSRQRVEQLRDSALVKVSKAFLAT